MGGWVGVGVCVCVCVCVCVFSCVLLFGDPMDHSCRVLLSMEFSRQEYWNGLPFPPPGVVSRK